MNIENEVFKRSKINFSKLLKYGFKKEDNIYKYSKNILNDTFRVDITITESVNISGKIYDIAFDEEYTNYRMETQIGEFVSKVREEFIKLLTDIKEKTATPSYFINEQSNEITKLIKEKYKDEPIFPWEKNPGFGVFKNPDNEKWYGLVMNIDKNKIDKKCYGEVEIINLKLSSKKVKELIKKEGIYPAYHMNKNYWVSIILDGTLKSEEIMNYIIESHKFTENLDEWLIPANPKYYDIISYFKEQDTITWKQPNNIKVGDVVYIYVGIPYSAILYKCEVIEINIPCNIEDDNLKMNKVIKIKLLRKYNKNQFTFTKLKEYGITSIRGPRHINENLSISLNK